MEIKRNLNLLSLKPTSLPCLVFQSPMEIKRNLNETLEAKIVDSVRKFQSPMEIKRNLNKYVTSAPRSWGLTVSISYGDKEKFEQ